MDALFVFSARSSNISYLLMDLWDAHILGMLTLVIHDETGNEPLFPLSVSLIISLSLSLPLTGACDR